MGSPEYRTSSGYYKFNYLISQILVVYHLGAGVLRFAETLAFFRKRVLLEYYF